MTLQASPNPIQPPAPATNPFGGTWGFDVPADEAPPLDWLWQGYLAPGNVTLLTSQWKSGKTTLVSVLLARLRDGGLLAGLPVKPSMAVVISEENPMLWYQRNQKLHFGGHICWFCQPFDAKPSLEQWRALCDHIAGLCRQHPIGLVVVDPLANFLPGRSENLAEAMLQALDPLRQLSRLGLALLLLHHPRKGEVKAGQASRGSGALGAYVDILLEMSWFANPLEPDRRRVIQAYSRHEFTPRRLVIELTPQGTDYLSHGDLPPDDFALAWKTVQAILRSTPAPQSRRDLLRLWPPQVHKPDPATLWRWLQDFLAQGLIRQLGQGRRFDPFRFQLVAEEREVA